MAEIDKQYY